MRTILPTLLILAFTVYCLVSIVQAPDGALRNLPRWAWLLLVLFFPLAGGLAYLIAGRPVGIAPTPRRPGPRGPDDDEEFLKGL
jgi:hypothetical protein